MFLTTTNLAYAIWAFGSILILVGVTTFAVVSEVKERQRIRKEIQRARSKSGISKEKK